MNSEYILRINTDEEKYNTLTTMLGVKPTSTKAYWELSINERSGQYRDAINYFLELIENHIEKLNKIGIKKEDLSLWYLYV